MKLLIWLGFKLCFFPQFPFFRSPLPIPPLPHCPVPRSPFPVPRSSFLVLVTSLPECLQLQACRLYFLSMPGKGNCYLITVCQTPLLVNTVVFHQCGKNRPLQLVCFISPMKFSGEFDPQSFHMHVNKTKFERNSFLEHYHMTFMGKTNTSLRGLLSLYLNSVTLCDWLRNLALLSK